MPIDTSGASQSTSEIAVWTGIMGVPIFLTFWYFFALRPLVTRGVDEDEEQDDDSSAAGATSAKRGRGGRRPKAHGSVDSDESTRKGFQGDSTVSRSGSLLHDQTARRAAPTKPTKVLVRIIALSSYRGR